MSLLDLWLLVKVNTFKSSDLNDLATLFLSSGYWLAIATVLTVIAKAI